MNITLKEKNVLLEGCQKNKVERRTVKNGTAKDKHKLASYVCEQHV